MLGYMGLNEEGRPVRIDTGAQEIHRDLEGAVLDGARVSVVGCQRMPIDDTVKSLVLFLHGHPVVPGAHQITQVRMARRPDSGQHALATHSPPPNCKRTLTIGQAR